MTTSVKQKERMGGSLVIHRASAVVEAVPGCVTPSPWPICPDAMRVEDNGNSDTSNDFIAASGVGHIVANAGGGDNCHSTWMAMAATSNMTQVCGGNDYDSKPMTQTTKQKHIQTREVRLIQLRLKLTALEGDSQDEIRCQNEKSSAALNDLRDISLVDSNWIAHFFTWHGCGGKWVVLEWRIELYLVTWPWHDLWHVGVFACVSSVRIGRAHLKPVHQESRTHCLQTLTMFLQSYTHNPWSGCVLHYSDWPVPPVWMCFKFSVVVTIWEWSRFPSSWCLTKISFLNAGLLSNTAKHHRQGTIKLLTYQTLG